MLFIFIVTAIIPNHTFVLVNTLEWDTDSRKTLLSPICMLIVIILLYNFIDVTCLLGIQLKYILTKNLSEDGTKKSVLRDHRLSSLLIPSTDFFLSYPHTHD